MTNTPCTGDSDCAVAPGTRCNTALASPRCEPLECGIAGEACAGPEFCGAGLFCFNSAHFGETTTIYSKGVCTRASDTVATCVNRCMQAWTASMGQVLYPCSQSQAQPLCDHVCGAYPAWTSVCEMHFEQINANDFNFGYVNCEPSLCPQIGIKCGTSTANAFSDPTCM